MIKFVLQNNFNKKRLNKSWDNYKKKNSCVKLLRQIKEKYFDNINVKHTSDKKN